ncbi:unnamed protein product [Thelazia callipaeda]|uniref:Transcription initiation factor TFIID subunit 12 n=1 Tax=Thelazia callipaeda TaxID=103827 RepID=A0A0N5CPU9_THECL|nr:unnamed protein product [Thelazia callipaeda]
MVSHSKKKEQKNKMSRTRKRACSRHSTSADASSASKSIESEDNEVLTSGIFSRTAIDSNTTQIADNEESNDPKLNHNTFWNFAISMSNPILHEKIANDNVVNLVLQEVHRQISQLITGAKIIMQQSKRQRLLCEDLNTYSGMKNGKVLYGFSEDNQWRKIGDVFVPRNEILDLQFLSESVWVETCNDRKSAS